MRRVSSVSFLVTMAFLAGVGMLLDVGPGISQALLGAGAMAVMITHAARTTGTHRLVATVVAILMAGVVFHGLIHAHHVGEASQDPGPVPARSGPADLIRS